MKETAKLVAVLTIISVVAGFLLAQVHAITKEPIAKAAEAELLAGLAKVLPSEYDNEPNKDIVTVIVGETEWVFYVAKQKGAFAGAAFEVMSDAGYGGDINCIVGIDTADQIVGIEILKQTETPGLGAKITEDGFRKQYSRDISDMSWCKVQKDGGEVVAITGATISSRAVSVAVSNGIDAYKSNIAVIRGE